MRWFRTFITFYAIALNRQRLAITHFIYNSLILCASLFLNLYDFRKASAPPNKTSEQDPLLSLPIHLPDIEILQKFEFCDINQPGKQSLDDIMVVFCCLSSYVPFLLVATQTQGFDVFVLGKNEIIKI